MSSLAARWELLKYLDREFSSPRMLLSIDSTIFELECRTAHALVSSNTRLPLLISAGSSDTGNQSTWPTPRRQVKGGGRGSSAVPPPPGGGRRRFPGRVVPSKIVRL